MNCEEFELVVRDLARSDLGDRNVEQSHGANEHEQKLALDEAVVHVDGCEACALRLQDERALNRKLDALAAEMTYFAPPVRIEAELLRAFRQSVAPSASSQTAVSQLAARSVPGSKRIWPALPKSYWITAAAAVLLIVFGIVLVRAKLSPTELAGPPVANIHQLQPGNALAGDSTPVPADGSGKGSAGSVPPHAAPSKGVQEVIVRRMRTKPRRLIRQPVKDDGDASPSASSAAVAATTQPQAIDEQTEPEVMTQFIALSYVAPANLQDGGQIVRVELPRSAMASFGLPVNMERLGERVKADVLVSADGFARAIRFVQ